jgi:hypothetical protein
MLYPLVVIVVPEPIPLFLIYNFIFICSAAFVLKHPLVASAIFGATKSWQLHEVLKACMIELTPEIIAEINNIHARIPNPCP